MERSYRGLGLVALVLLVVAPLTLFAVLALFEDESQDAIRLSLDGERWTQRLDGALLATPQAWSPGEARSAIVYVENAGPDPVDADVLVSARSDDPLVRDGYLGLVATVGRAAPQPFASASATNLVVVENLASDSTVPVTLTATLAATAPIGATLESETLRLSLRVSGTRTPESGSPSLLDATGAELWLAPVFLVVAAVVAVWLRSRRRGRYGSPPT